MRMASLSTTPEYAAARTMPIRVAIVEDDREIREGLTWLFRNSPGFDCAQAFGSAEEALDALPALKPEVVLMDIHLPGISGIECVNRLKPKCPGTQFCMLTVFEDDDAIFRSLAAGAIGYILKKTPPTAILQAVQDLSSGGSPISAQIARRVVSAFTDPKLSRQKGASNRPVIASDNPEGLLCEREREILDLLALGHRYKEIADALGISIHTVRTFIRRMYEKLHVHSRTEALIRMHKAPR